MSEYNYLKCCRSGGDEAREAQGQRSGGDTDSGDTRTRTEPGRRAGDGDEEGEDTSCHKGKYLRAQF